MLKPTKKTAADKPTKPYPDFPLFPHATKCWAKKSKKTALLRYMDTTERNQKPLNFMVEISPGHAAGLSVVYRSSAADQGDCLRDVGILFGMETKTMNFFNWIREGVRQAVLYGVHDAVGELGPSHSGQDMNARMLHLLRTAPETETPRLGTPSSGGSASSSRKRLGRSLGDIQATMETSE